MPQPGNAAADQPKQLALYLRYQTIHSRFYKALNELQKLRKTKEKEEIGFVSQKRREAAENRAEMFHEARVWLVET